jgi:hypothetical protein
MLQNKSRVVHQSCCHQHKQKLFEPGKKVACFAANGIHVVQVKGGTPPCAVAGGLLI